MRLGLVGLGKVKSNPDLEIVEKETYLRDFFLAFIALQCSFMANLAFKYVDILGKSPRLSSPQLWSPLAWPTSTSV